MRFDHLIHLVPDLKAALSEYERLGFMPRMGGEHPGHGTHNAVVRSGLTYIELLGVCDWAEFRRYEEGRRKRYPGLTLRTEEILEAGGGASGFAIEVDDIRTTVAKAQAAGLPMASPTLGKIVRPDGSESEWGMAGLTEDPSWLPFLIQYANLRGAGQDDQRWALDHVLVETSRPAEGAHMLSRLLGLPVSMVGRDQFRVPLPGCAVVVRSGSAERITTVAFSRSTDPTGEICGIGYVVALPGSTEEAQIIVRPFVTDDIERFTAWRATDDYLAGFVRKETQEHLDGKRILLVAQAGDRLVGTIQLVPNHEDHDLADGHTTAYLEALEVKEDFRRRGLGTWLMTTVERLAVELGFRRLTLMVEPGNGPALSLYRKLGFVFFKDSNDFWRGKSHPVRCMEKGLTGLPNDWETQGDVREPY